MPIKVLVVDDSALIRELLTKLLEQDPNIKVVGTAPDPLIAREKIKALNPDVLTLDIEMPRMDGLSFLEKLMALRPMPVVVVSTLTQKGADAAVRALELGAVECVPKPLMNIRDGMVALGAVLIEAVTAAASASVAGRGPRQPPANRGPVKFDASLSQESHIIAIGASTGGVEALGELLTRMPANSPAIIITQHMPSGFTRSFAERLDKSCAITVAEAYEGARVSAGYCYIANGDRHLELARSGARYVCKLGDGDRVSGHKPSVDVLFRSVAHLAGANATGVILTGMGRDGAEGLLEMRKAGARTLGQDESSCLIYGMPKAARQLGAVERELPLSAIPQAILH